MLRPNDSRTIHPLLPNDFSGLDLPGVTQLMLREKGLEKPSHLVDTSDERTFLSLCNTSQFSAAREALALKDKEEMRRDAALLEGMILDSLSDAERLLLLLEQQQGRSSAGTELLARDCGALIENAWTHTSKMRLLIPAGNNSRELGALVGATASRLQAILGRQRGNFGNFQHQDAEKCSAGGAREKISFKTFAARAEGGHCGKEGEWGAGDTNFDTQSISSIASSCTSNSPRKSFGQSRGEGSFKDSSSTNASFLHHAPPSHPIHETVKYSLLQAQEHLKFEAGRCGAARELARELAREPPARPLTSSTFAKLQVDARAAVVGAAGAAVAAVHVDGSERPPHSLGVQQEELHDKTHTQQDDKKQGASAEHSPTDPFLSRPSPDGWQMMTGQRFFANQKLKLKSCDDPTAAFDTPSQIPTLLNYSSLNESRIANRWRAARDTSTVRRHSPLLNVLAGGGENAGFTGSSGKKAWSKSIAAGGGARGQEFSGGQRSLHFMPDGLGIESSRSSRLSVRHNRFSLAQLLLRIKGSADI
jgi:hypothetical protein